MFEGNWKTYLLVALVGLGVFAEVIKHFPGRKAAYPWESERPTSPAQPYSVRQMRERTQTVAQRTPPPKVGLSQQQLANLAAQSEPQATTFEGEAKDSKKEAAKGAEKKKKEECDEKNPKIDPLTGQAIACKKKKKKDEEKKEVVEEKTPPSSDDSDTNIDNAIHEAIVTGGVPRPLPNKPDDAFDSIENWAKRLLAYPNLAETKRFIDHYQRNLVAADVYYRIVQQMLNDPRTEMKSLGVMCLGLTPSVLSFQMLTKVLQSERSDSPPHVQAESFASRYSDMANLAIVERVLRTPNVSYATIVATQKLDIAARRYLNASSVTVASSQPSKNPAALAQAQIALVRNSGFFQRFVSVLKDLERSTDRNVAAQSSSTLASLQSLLNAAQTALSTKPPTQPAQTT